MALRQIATILLTILISCSMSGCLTAGANQAKVDISGKTFAQIYEQSKQPVPLDILNNPGGALQMGAQMGYSKPYLPIYQQPKIIKVWIPPHKSKDDANVLIAGHWSYVMIEDPSWYIDNEITKEMSVDVIVPSLPEKN